MKSLSVKAIKDKAIDFLSARNTRERALIVVLALVVLVAADFLLIIRPIVGTLFDAAPEISSLKAEVRSLRDDQKNKALIAKQFSEMGDTLAEREQFLIVGGQDQQLLESLSSMARESNVKIVSINPIQGKDAADTSYYSPVPFSVNAQAGTHDLGAFLSRLEAGKTFFRVSNLRIMPNGLNPEKHNIEIEVQAYRKA